MRFEIKESEWLQGNLRQSVLSNDECKRCCLGFLGLACNWTDKEMHNIAVPEDLYGINYDFESQHFNLWGPLLDINESNEVFNTNLCKTIVFINDLKVGEIIYNGSLPEDGLQMTYELRKQILKHLFAEAGHEVIFVP